MRASFLNFYACESMHAWHRPCSLYGQEDTETETRRSGMTRASWYARPEFWILMGTLFVPFFWILPLSRAAYARVAIRRERRF